MDYIDLKTAAKKTSLSVYTMYKFVKQGMPYYKVGRKYLFEEDEFNAWLAQNYKSTPDDNDIDLDKIIKDALDDIDNDDD
ncbi:MAG: excisionase family DNA-binding protein [Desulfobacterales bacterium]|nr:excisionase family DNA-binding protein [Desulfobacterales bacterium]